MRPQRGTRCDLGGRSSSFTIIEHAGYASQSSWSSGLTDASAQLLCDITDDWDIPIDRYHVVGHGQLQPYNRVDPGPNWPWGAYLDRASALCGASGGGTGGGGTGGGGGSGGDGGSAGGEPSSSGAIDLVIDSNSYGQGPDTEIEVSGYWTGSNNVAGYYNTGYYWRSTGSSADAASFWFYLPQPETLTVQAWWAAASDRSRAAPFISYDATGAEIGRITVDQSSGGGAWATLGTYDFTEGWNRVALSRWTTPGYVVIADAVRVTNTL